jgi:hypothetical protein
MARPRHTDRDPREGDRDGLNHLPRAHRALILFETRSGGICHPDCGSLEDTLLDTRKPGPRANDRPSFGAIGVRTLSRSLPNLCPAR